MFDFNLKYKKPMICAMVAGGIGAAYMNFFGGGATAVILPGLLALPTYIADSHIHVIISVIISIVVAFVGTLVLGIDEETDEDIKDTVSNKITKTNMSQPVKGKAIPLNEIKDDAFASGALGEGFGVIPEEGVVYSPFDGTVEMIFPTKHAIGIKSKDGMEVLIHIGLDTINLNGEGFETFVKDTQSIKKGDKLIKFDINKIEEKGYDATVCVVVTNSGDYSSVKTDFTNFDKVLCGE